MHHHHRIRSIILVVIVTALAVALGARPAQAATWYVYKPGHPMGPSTGAANNCTGSWAVRGPSGLFFLTAGHCQWAGTVVYGLEKAFGSVRRNDNRRGGRDAALVEPYAGVDAWQDVVNSSEGVIGHTVGKVGNSELPGGMYVNMVGRTTGWTWGQIDSRWFVWANGELVKCAIYKDGSGKGDSGGPVFTRDSSNRAKAVGMHVGKAEVTPGVFWSCFLTIDDLLRHFGATLPVFSAAGVTSYAGPSADATAARAQPVKPLRYILE